MTVYSASETTDSLPRHRDPIWPGPASPASPRATCPLCPSIPPSIKGYRVAQFMTEETGPSPTTHRVDMKPVKGVDAQELIPKEESTNSPHPTLLLEGGTCAFIGSETNQWRYLAFSGSNFLNVLKPHFFFNKEMYASNLTVPIHAWPPVRPGLAHGPQAAFPIPGAAAAVSARAPALSLLGNTCSTTFLHFVKWGNDLKTCLSSHSMRTSTSQTEGAQERLTDRGKGHFKYTLIGTSKQAYWKWAAKSSPETLLRAIPTDRDATGKVTSPLGRHHFKGKDTFKELFLKCKTCEGIFFFK